MAKFNFKKINWSMERKALAAFAIIFVAVVGSAWIYAMKLRQTVAANNSITLMDSSALVEVERLRNLAESQIANSKAYILLGAKSIFDQQEKEKDELMKSLASFEKQYSLPQVPEIIKRIESIEQKNKEFFDQAMEFRDKKTESKIVGQFFQAKTSPLRTQLDDAFDDIAKLHKAEIDRVNAQARGSVVSVESQIPQGMTWFTGSMALIFLAMGLWIVRLLRERPAHIAERNRLYTEAIKAVQSRDEAIFAVAHDLNESLEAIKSTAERLETSGQSEAVKESAELVKGNVQVIEGLIKDIRDQKSSEMEGLILRLDQLGIDEVLESARLLMAPMAKQRDVRIQVDTVNPPVLAFYDRERVLRVLSNLIGNAIKASPKGGKVVVKVRSDQKFVNISVVDNGSGIPDSQQEGIFDNFWQARKTADQGAGIGLAIVKTTVEAHGGTVQLQSQSGRGSTFTFSLPRRRPVGAPVRKLAPAVRSSATAHLDFHEGPNL